MKKYLIYKIQNLLIALFILSLIFLSLNIKAQDIIVKTDKSRINTHIINYNDSIVNCKSLQNKSDTIFFIKTNEIDFVLFAMGNIKYFVNTKPLDTTTYKQENIDAKKNNQYVSVDTLNNDKTETKIKSTELVPIKDNANIYNFEIGSGITAGGTFNSAYTNENIVPFQINLRFLCRFSNPSKIGLGLNLNYSNLATIAIAKRYSVHGVGQIYLIRKSSFLIYLNGMAGLAIFDNYDLGNSGNNGLFWRSGVLPSIHCGIGFKSYWSDNSGYFIETGVGGPYLINAGVFF